MANPHAVLREAIGGNRLLGVVMIGLTMLICLPAMMEFPKQNLALEMMSVSACIFLLGPGILYQIAASGMNNRAEQAGWMSRKIAIWHSIASLLALPIALAFHEIAPAAIPLLANLFFVPAALVQAWKISRAIEAIRLLPPAGPAFEPVMSPQISKVPLGASDKVTPPARSLKPVEAQARGDALDSSQ